MAKVDKKGLARRVQARRDALRLSQKQLALAADMKQQGIANIESAIVGRPRNLPEIAKALLTTVDWLLYERGPEVVKTVNAREEAVNLVHSVAPERLGAAIQYLKSLTECDDSEVA